MNEIEKWLNCRIGLNFRSGLERMQRAVDLLGNPERAYPVIHVTGTNGKGSTIAFMRNLFADQGKKVASFTSPHMVSIHDRICINGFPISDADFVRLGRQIQEMERELVKTHDQLSYFEILTLLAFLYFREEQVDLALIEVGIGGLLDTTNVLDGQVAVVTSVGLDHQETLGQTLTAIAEQKAGIFKSGRSAVIGPLPEEARQVCEQRAASLDLDLYEYGRDFSFSDGSFKNQDLLLSHLILGLQGVYQEENAALALQVFLLFMKQMSWEIDFSMLPSSLQKTHWAGRLEEISPNIYLDGAHNLPALERLVEFIQEKIQQGYQPQILFGALKRKDYSGMLGYLTDHLPDTALYVTSFDYQGSLEEQDLSDYHRVASYRDFIDDFEKSAGEKDLLFVTGSLYFISEVRAYLIKT